MDAQTGTVLNYLGFEQFIDFELSKSGVSPAAVFTLNWLSATPQPTEAEITAAEASADYLSWRDENGGDAVKTLRKEAELELSALKREAAALRAFMLLVVDELNSHSDTTNAVLSAAAAATSLASFKSGMAAISALPTRTGAQLRTAVINKIRAGNADN